MIVSKQKFHGLFVFHVADLKTPEYPWLFCAFSFSLFSVFKYVWMNVFALDHIKETFECLKSHGNENRRNAVFNDKLKTLMIL